eukprot:11135899-Prorocentrum_lima.AAC.1
MGYWWTGFTRFKVKHVIAKYHTTGVEAIFDSTLKQALMADQSELFSMWEHHIFSYHLTNCQKGQPAHATQ